MKLYDKMFPAKHQECIHTLEILDEPTGYKISANSLLCKHYFDLLYSTQQENFREAMKYN